jgi:hypothetical protein
MTISVPPDDFHFPKLDVGQNSNSSAAPRLLNLGTQGLFADGFMFGFQHPRLTISAIIRLTHTVLFNSNRQGM